MIICVLHNYIWLYDRQSKRLCSGQRKKTSIRWWIVQNPTYIDCGLGTCFCCLRRKWQTRRNVITRMMIKVIPVKICPFEQLLRMCMKNQERWKKPRIFHGDVILNVNFRKFPLCVMVVYFAGSTWSGLVHPNPDLWEDKFHIRILVNKKLLAW